MKKMLVVTGSFNPITKAHFLLMKNALDKINGDIGLFVITNDAYLHKKMIADSKTPSSFILSEEIRKEMVEGLKNEDPRIQYGGTELGNESPSTQRTLAKIIKKYPDYEMYFLVGADKVNGLQRWQNVDTLLRSLNLIIYGRNDVDISKIINKSPLFSKYKDKISVINDVEDTEGISSTLVRERFFNGKDYSNLLCPSTYKIMSRYSKDDFPQLSDEEIIKNIILYGGRFGENKARNSVYKSNKKIFTKNIKELRNKSKNTIAYTKEVLTSSNNSYKTTFSCKNIDCADEALSLIEKGYKPAILNLASGFKPCGGYDKGCNAQEESLCYMSDLSMSLYQFGNPKYKCVRESGLDLKTGVYPTDINFGGVYSPKVTFFRNNIDKFYSLREKPFNCDVISVASLANRGNPEFSNNEDCYFNSDGTLTPEGLKIESNKIRTIYRIALLNGNDSLVLGAFGCGVYHLLPEEVASLFKKILEENEFKNKFKHVSFAIFEGKGSKRKIVGKQGKFKPFYDIFDK